LLSRGAIGTSLNWAYHEFRFYIGLGMTRKSKPQNANPRKTNLLLAVVVVIALLLLILRMINFVAGHGHHRL
jgi:hypothetical protein